MSVAWSEVEMATRGQLSIFFKARYFLAKQIFYGQPGSTVNLFLGVNILSFTFEGESIYVQDMFCLLIGCGNAWRQNTSDTTLRFYALQFTSKTDVEWGREIGMGWVESIIGNSQKSGVTDFLSMNSPRWAVGCPLSANCCPAQ